VMALRVAIALGSTPIGAPIVGWVANNFGPRWALASRRRRALPPPWPRTPWQPGRTVGEFRFSASDTHRRPTFTVSALPMEHDCPCSITISLPDQMVGLMHLVENGA